MRRRRASAIPVPLPSRSRYQPDAAPDYSHRFHAGNVGDVWKHCALIEVLRRTAATTGRGPIAYLDTHAGDGRYPLAATGEWTDGIGRLWNMMHANESVARYVALCRRLGAGDARPVRYPGSPLLARAVLGDVAELELWERDPSACEQLRPHVSVDPRTRLTCDDGLVALADAARAAERRTAAVVVLIDPPYTQKADWIAVPDALSRAVSATDHTCFMLWYPVKSLTRPNAMFARLAAAHVAATIVEVVTTPLHQQRRRLNGSGVLLVRPPSGTLEALAAAAAAVGAACATIQNRWSTRLQSWAEGT
jgi:23S rRNA (adenine2030-N6)-methyltransferase